MTRHIYLFDTSTSSVKHELPTSNPTITKKPPQAIHTTTPRNSISVSKTRKISTSILDAASKSYKTHRITRYTFLLRQKSIHITRSIPGCITSPEYIHMNLTIRLQYAGVYRSRPTGQESTRIHRRRVLLHMRKEETPQRQAN